MDTAPPLFTESQIEGVTELILGTADFVSRPIIVLASEQIIQFIDERKPERLILNFKNVSHISSEFITAMIHIRDHVMGHDGLLKLSHMNESVLAPFKITKLAGRLFMIYETSAEAVDSF